MVEYASGRRADVYGHQSQRTALMWHGAQTDARTTMRPLAERLADCGFGVVVPDWNSHADDRGRADLLRSLEFAHERADSAGLVLVGWSLGGVAAAGATVNAGRHGVRLSHTVCLAGAFMVPDPISGQHLPTDLTGYGVRPPFTLLHGAADDVIPVTVSQRFAATLRQAGWPVSVAEIDADHGAIAGAVYDRCNDRYLPGDEPQILAVAADVATRIAAAAAESDT